MTICIICYKQAGARFDPDRLKECSRANPDGWGIMYALKGELHTEKGLDVLDDFSMFNRIVNTPVAIHFRTASVGAISIENCHPHKVNDDLAFMHNGNLFHFRKPGQTDSQVFAQFCREHWPITWTNLEDYCWRNYSKILFMDFNGTVWIVNEQAGMWENGCWYSNGGIPHYIGYGYSGAYGYSETDVRHKGGALSVQGFANAQEWAKCLECGGWFYRLQTEYCDDCKAYKALKDGKD